MEVKLAFTLVDYRIQGPDFEFFSQTVAHSQYAAAATECTLAGVELKTSQPKVQRDSPCTCQNNVKGYLYKKKK